MDKIYCNIASLPEREESLERTVKSIINQVDFVKVMLNRYTGVPKCLQNNPKISYVHTQNELGDASKFLGIDDYDGYVLTLDDDLEVSPDYADYLIEGVEKYNAIVSLHGRTMKPRPIHSYYHGFEQVFACLSEVKEDHKADVVGTGVMCFHTDFYRISPLECPIPNMADVWNAKHAKSLGVDMYVLKHDKTMLKHTAHNWNIYRTLHKEIDIKATSVYNDF